MEMTIHPTKKMVTPMTTYSVWAFHMHVRFLQKNCRTLFVCLLASSVEFLETDRELWVHLRVCYDMAQSNTTATHREATWQLQLYQTISQVVYNPMEYHSLMQKSRYSRKETERWDIRRVYLWMIGWKNATQIAIPLTDLICSASNARFISWWRCVIIISTHRTEKTIRDIIGAYTVGRSCNRTAQLGWHIFSLACSHLRSQSNPNGIFGRKLHLDCFGFSNDYMIHVPCGQLMQDCWLVCWYCSLYVPDGHIPSQYNAPTKFLVTWTVKCGLRECSRLTRLANTITWALVEALCTRDTLTIHSHCSWRALLQYLKIIMVAIWSWNIQSETWFRFECSMIKWQPSSYWTHWMELILRRWCMCEEIQFLQQMQ